MGSAYFRTSVQPESSSNGPSEAAAHEKAAEGNDKIDFSLLADSLRLTHWQRLVENERSLALVRMLEEARRQPHGAS